MITIWLHHRVFSVIDSILSLQARKQIMCTSYHQLPFWEAISNHLPFLYPRKDLAVLSYWMIRVVYKEQVATLLLLVINRGLKNFEIYGVPSHGLPRGVKHLDVIGCKYHLSFAAQR